MKLRDYLDADWAAFFAFGEMEPRPRRFRDNFSPRFAPIYLLRVSQALHQRGFRRIAKLFALANFVIFGIEVRTGLVAEPGLVLPHTVGTILGAGHIGANVTIYQQVTLGARTGDFHNDPATRPHVCDGVTIFAGAKILGPIRLGANCVIGANAVVLADVPEGALAAGVPATIRERRSGSAEREGADSA